MASAATNSGPAQRPAPGCSSTAITAIAAAIVVGTPEKNRPFFGETLNRASRIAAQIAVSTHAAPATTVGLGPTSHANTTTGVAMPNEHMSANESICAP